jgi:hypothetical protein
MIDYSAKYLTDEGFDLPQLLNDDFFVAIKLLFNNRGYVSATKRLLSFVDSRNSSGDPRNPLWSEAISCHTNRRIGRLAWNRRHRDHFRIAGARKSR